VGGEGWCEVEWRKAGKMAEETMRSLTDHRHMDDDHLQNSI
jgi:hypothetical protein